MKKIIALALVLVLCLSLFAACGKKEEPAPEAKPARLCPFCKGEIHDEAVRCPHCTSVLE